MKKIKKTDLIDCFCDDQIENNEMNPKYLVDLQAHTWREDLVPETSEQ